MQTDQLDPALLRRLASVRPEHGRVVSLFVNLDPSTFATQPARASQIRSLLDTAEGLARTQELNHDANLALRRDIERLRQFFETDFSAQGAHGLAVFASDEDGLFETIKLPRPVDADVVIDAAPWLEPLTEQARGEHVAVVLVNRRIARLFRGTGQALEEVRSIEDEVHGQHRQGGWAQARYQRSVEHDVQVHLKHAAEDLFEEWKQRRFDRLLVGATEELMPAFAEHLHSELRARVLGRFDVDVENAQADDVQRAVDPLLEQDRRRRERDALERLAAGLGRGERAAVGLANVLDAINERRVEALLHEPGLAAGGVACRTCGWLGVERATCPIDGSGLERRDNVVTDAIDSVLLQSGEAIPVTVGNELSDHGGIAALLRF